jgi:GTP-dependent phosphoenolpyruvate carboxykinase
MTHEEYCQHMLDRLQYYKPHEHPTFLYDKYFRNSNQKEYLLWLDMSTKLSVIYWSIRRDYKLMVRKK